MSSYEELRDKQEAVILTGVADWNRSLDNVFWCMGFSVLCLATCSGTCNEPMKQAGRKYGKCSPRFRRWWKAASVGYGRMTSRCKRPIECRLDRRKLGSGSSPFD